MKRKKDLFDQFRDNQHKLDERPSKDAWRKLEGKLDARKTRHTTSIYRQLAMVAAVIALVAIVSVISLLVEKQNDQFAAADKTASPYQLEDLEVYTDAGGNPYKIVEFQRKHNSRISNPTIREGSRKQRLVAINTTVTDEGNSNTMIAGSFKTAPEKSPTNSSTGPIAAMMEKKKEVINPSSSVVIDSKNTPAKEQVIAAPAPIVEKDIVQYEEAGFEEEEEVTEDDAVVMSATEMEPPAAAPVTKVEPEEEPNFGENLNYSYSEAKDNRKTEEQIRNKSRTATSSTAYSEQEKIVAETSKAAPQDVQYAAKAKKQTAATRSNSTYDKSLDLASNQISVGATTPQPGLSKFQWLIGQWKGNSPTGNSFEDWRMVNDFTIQGEGFIVVNGDTIFTEGMRIQRLGDDLYYIVALDDSRKPVKFKLKTYAEQQAVFENEDIAFPNQVIIRKNASNSYTTILQNKEPAQIQTEQLNYINQRNAIRNEQAIRNLERVTN